MTFEEQFRAQYEAAGFVAATVQFAKSGLVVFVHRGNICGIGIGKTIAEAYAEASADIVHKEALALEEAA